MATAAREERGRPGAELVVLDAASESKPSRSREDEERELHEVIMRSLEETGESTDASDQARCSQFCVDDGSGALLCGIGR